MNRLFPHDNFRPGDRVRIKEGPFARMEGTIVEVRPTVTLAIVRISIFGRDVPVEVKYDQLEAT